MNKSFFLFSFIFVVSISSANAQLKNILDKAKESVSSLKGDNTDISKGLKEALDKGVESAVNQLSADNGYLSSQYKILIPEDAQKVIDKVKMIPGFEDVETKLINQMNKAAEIAAKKATPIFAKAITDMSFADAKNILTGPENAATTYLSNSSRQALFTEFMPIIQSSLDEVNARSYWKSITTAYNKIPFVKKMNPDLDNHVNNKALDGLFGVIAVKEKGIRTDVNQRTSDLLMKVFGNQ